MKDFLSEKVNEKNISKFANGVFSFAKWYFVFAFISSLVFGSLVVYILFRLAVHLSR
jgi:ATP/ADP translocase